MEKEYTLPEIFEEFSDSRRNAFLEVKKQKEMGQPIIGTFCTYFPEELVMAMGAKTVSLCSMSQETVPDGEKELPSNLCPLIKSSYGFAKTDKCPFFYFADLIIGETTCDGKKKMYEQLAKLKPMYVMELPNSQSEQGLKRWRNEIIRMKEKLEEVFSVRITDEKLKEAIHQKNLERRALKNFYELMKLDPPPMKGSNMYDVLYSSGYSFDKDEYRDSVFTVNRMVMEEYEKTKDSISRKPRILITGSPIGGATNKVIHAVEEQGGVVVAFENCGGAKAIDELTDESNPDIYEALAKRYLNIGCSCMSPNPHRRELLGRLIEEYKVDGVLDMVLHACHTYNMETTAIGKMVREQYHVAYMTLETDYSEADVGQMNTRIRAFIETLE
jgi:benzoyl-CoA reductase/2-hydroxyglutaryl-CoA dehydratase subunit BcrC/BadD/HgdB